MPQIPEIIEALHPSLHDPKLAVAGGLLVAGAVVAEQYKAHLERGNQGLPVADPEAVALALPEAEHVSRRRERIGYYAAAGAIGLGLVQLAGPYAAHQEIKGSTVVILDASNQSRVNDISANGAVLSRAKASVEGAVTASANSEVPFTLFESSSETVVGQSKDAPIDAGNVLGKVMNLEPTVTNTVPSLVDAASKAANITGTEPSNVIIISPNANGEGAELKKLQATLKKQNKQLYAVALGSGKGEYTVANTKLTAPVDVQSFVTALGADYVQTATSEQAITDAVDKIASTTVVAETEQPIDWFGKAAILAGLVAAAAISRKRLSGIFSRKGRK